MPKVKLSQRGAISTEKIERETRLASIKAKRSPAAGGAGAGAEANISPPHVIHDMTPAQKIGLSLADNLHDAAGGYRNKADAQAVTVKAALMTTFARITGGACNVIDTCLEGSMSPKVIQSNIEDSTISFFEDTVDYLQRPSPAAEATYDQIIREEVSTFIIRSKYDTFRILPGSQSVKDITSVPGSEDTKKITDFILEFLVGSSDAPTYMTFDASPMAVGRLFRGHENVCGLIIPQNIGDSATTSFKQLGAEPDLYEFPETVSGSGRFYAQRNVLSSDRLGIFYANDGFCSKFPFKISFGLEAVEGAAAVSMSYEQAGYTQGPSLDYLIDLMIAAQTGGSLSDITTSSGCLRIGDVIDRSAIDPIVRETLGGVFMDIKRGGDQDVADAVLTLLQSSVIMRGKNIIAVTLDRLCSLLYRLLGIPCIYHHGDELILYKNHLTDRSVDQATIAAFKAAKDAKFVAEYMPLVVSYKNNLVNLGSFASSIQTVYSCERNTLHKDKFADIFNRLKVVFETATANIAPIAATRPNIEAYLKLFNDKGIDTKFLIGLKPVLDTPTIFDRTRDYGYLNYSNEMFDTLIKAYKGFMIIKGRTRPLRDPENYEVILNKVGGYNAILRDYTKSFFDPAVGTRLYKAYAFLVPAVNTDIAKGYRKSITDYETLAMEVSSISATGEGSAARKRLDPLKREAITSSTGLRELLTAYDPTVNAAPIAGCMGGGARQRGGAYSEDHVSLFKDICERAATFINSEIGRIYPESVKRYAAEQLIDALARWQTPVKSDAVKNIRRTRLSESYDFANFVFGGLAPLSSLTVYGLNSITDASLNSFPNIDDLILRVPDSTSSATLLDLYSLWSTGIIMDPADESLSAVKTLLDPYDDTGALKGGYPLIMLGDGLVKTLFIHKREGDVASGIYNRVTMYSLITLAFFDDLFKGNVGKRTSLLISRLGELPAKAVGFDITPEGRWNLLPGFITNILIQINNNTLSPEALGLMRGGTRSTKYRHTRRRGSKRNYNRTAKRGLRHKD